MKRKIHLWTKEQIEFIRNNSKGLFIKEIRDKLNAEYGINVTDRSVSMVMYRNGIKNRMQGASTRFKKGNEPWIKGKKGVFFGGENAKKTQFKKGGIPGTYRPVGSERVQEGWVRIKVADPNVWKKKHTHVWEQEHGEVPDGMMIRFRDNNHHNITLDNMFLTTTSAALSVSVGKRGHNDPNINYTTHMLAELEMKIRDMEVLS